MSFRKFRTVDFIATSMPNFFQTLTVKRINLEVRDETRSKINHTVEPSMFI